jgi:hypothetical protein
VAQAGHQATIVSTDKGYCQLLSPTIRIRDYFQTARSSASLPGEAQQRIPRCSKAARSAGISATSVSGPRADAGYAGRRDAGAAGRLRTAWDPLLGLAGQRSGRSAGFVLRQALVAPAVGAILIIKHRHRVGGLTVDNPEYKAGRAPMPDTLVAEMPALRAAFEQRGIRCWAQPWARSSSSNTATAWVG